MVPILLDGVKSGLYEIEEDGRIWSNYKKGYLNPSQDKDGYLRISLSSGTRNKKRYFRIANLVAIFFIGPPPVDLKDPTVNHIDGNITNNHFTNLEWMERGKNSSIRLNKGQGSFNHEAKLNEEQVREICNLLVNSNLSYEEIIKKYNITKSTLSSIKNKKHWKEITSKYDFSCRVVIRDEKGHFKGINTKFI